MIKEALISSEKTELIQKPAAIKPAAIKPTLIRIIELTGEIKHKGPFEIAPETTINKIISQFGGGMLHNNKAKAVQFGGAAGLCLNKADFGLTLDEALRKVGFTGKLTQISIISEGTSMVELARDSIEATIDGLCGKCIPCREGTVRVQEILDRLIDGSADNSDIALLGDLVNTISETSLCRLGKISVNTVESSLKFFREEYISLVKQDVKRSARIDKDKNECILKQAQIA